MEDMTTMLVERLWHKTRTMIVWREGGLQMAPPNDDRSHKQWFADTGWTDAYEANVRGFIDTTGIYLYKGSDYRWDLHVEQVAFLVWQLAKYKWSPEFKAMPIYGGMVPGQPGTRWLPQRRLY